MIHATTSAAYVNSQPALAMDTPASDQACPPTSAAFCGSAPNTAPMQSGDVMVPCGPVSIPRHRLRQLIAESPPHSARRSTLISRAYSEIHATLGSKANG